MKHQWITALVAISLIGTGQIMAEKGKGQGSGKERPDRAEMQKKMLEKFDADGDGKLNDEEREKAHAEMKKRGAERFAKADKNNDGKLTEDEVPAKAWKRMSKADKDGDGAVTKEELAKAHAAHNGKGGKGKGGNGKHGPPPIEQFDKNKDGKLSEDEVPADVWARMSKADKNADGFVSKEELEAAHKKRKGAKGGDKGKKKKTESDS